MSADLESFEVPCYNKVDFPATSTPSPPSPSSPSPPVQFMILPPPPTAYTPPLFSLVFDALYQPFLPSTGVVAPAPLLVPPPMLVPTNADVTIDMSPPSPIPGHPHSVTGQVPLNGSPPASLLVNQHAQPAVIVSDAPAAPAVLASIAPVVELQAPLFPFGVYQFTVPYPGMLPPIHPYDPYEFDVEDGITIPKATDEKEYLEKRERLDGAMACLKKATKCLKAAIWILLRVLYHLVIMFLTHRKK